MFSYIECKVSTAPGKTLTLRICVRVWILIRRAELDDVSHALLGAMLTVDPIIICWSVHCQGKTSMQKIRHTYVPIYDSVKLTLSITRCIVGRTSILRQSCGKLD
jgi:hypothetical protein